MSKKLIYALFILLFAMSSCTNKPQKYNSFNEYPVYEGNDLEYTYTPELTTFKLWSPEAEQVRVNIYDAGLEGEKLCTVDMDYDGDGVWSASFDEDLKGKFYTFQILFEGNWLEESVGAYAKAVGVNGVRGAIIDMAETNPEGWAEDKSPVLNNFNEISLYEVHVRDFSVSPTSGMKNK